VAAYAPNAPVILVPGATAGTGQERDGVRHLLRQVPSAGGVSTGEALFTQRDLCTTIVAAHGDSLVPVKENHPMVDG